MLQPPEHLGGPLWDLDLSVLYWGPKLDIIYQLGPNECQVKENNPFPRMDSGGTLATSLQENDELLTSTHSAKQTSQFSPIIL